MQDKMSKLNIKKDSVQRLKWHKHKFFYRLKKLKANIDFDQRYMDKSHMFSDKQFEREDLQNKIIEINGELKLRENG